MINSMNVAPVVDPFSMKGVEKKSNGKVEEQKQPTLVTKNISASEGFGAKSDNK